MSDTPTRKARRRAIRRAYTTDQDGECVVWTEAGGAVSVGVPAEPSDAPALAGVPSGTVCIVVELRGYVRRYRVRPSGVAALVGDRDMQRRMVAAWRPKQGRAGSLEDVV